MCTQLNDLIIYITGRFLSPRGRCGIRKKHRHHDQEKLLGEIRQRVLEESENLKEEKERLLDEKVTLEALQELTDLPMKRIKAISSEVKSRHRQENKPVRTTGQKIARIITFAVLALSVGLPVRCIVVSGINARKQRIQYEKEQKEREDYSKLLAAIKDSNLEMVRYHVLEEAAVIEPVTIESETPLMYAVREAANDIISFLIDNGADVLRRSRDGQSVMDIADEGSNIVTKKYISSAMVESTEADSPIRTLAAEGIYYSEKAFLDCLENGDRESVTLFLQADSGAYKNDYDEKGIPVSARNGDPGMLELLLTNGKDLSSDIKNIALVYASEEGHIPVIDYLLEQGADINFKYDLSHYSFRQDFTPLIAALAEKNSAAEHLLKKGADPNLEGSDYEMLPLMIPVFYIDNSILSESRLQQMRMLIKYGADVNRKTSRGENTIGYAQTLRASESRPITKLLIECGAEIPKTEEFFRELVFLGDAENVKDFLEYGMDPDLQGFEYYDEETTALIKAVMLGYDEIAAALIEKGADVNYRTPDYGKSPLLTAVINEDLSIVRLLLENGATVSKDVLNRMENYYTWTNDETQSAIRKIINKYR